MEFLKTSEKVEIQDYPWGFRLKTTMTKWIEFNKTHGFREVSQTIDPKNGRVCKPKKTTYSPVLVLTKDANGFIGIFGFGLNGTEKIIKGAKWLNNHFDLFAPEQIKYIYDYLLSSLVIDIRAKMTYCGAKQTDLMPLYQSAIDSVKLGLKDGLNHFDFVLDFEQIEACKVENFNPYKTTIYQTV